MNELALQTLAIVTAVTTTIPTLSPHNLLVRAHARPALTTRRYKTHTRARTLAHCAMSISHDSRSRCPDLTFYAQLWFRLDGHRRSFTLTFSSLTLPGAGTPRGRRGHRSCV